MSDKKYQIISSRYILTKDDDSCFLNGEKKEISELDGLKIKFYHDYFQQSFENIIVLCGAGSSLDNGSGKGKTRVELWDACKNEINALLRAISVPAHQKFSADNDIEALLSYVGLWEKINQGDKVVPPLRKNLEKMIASVCKLTLESSAPHKFFLNKITARKASSPRIQLFTTNYDTLFEQAASEAGFVVIDGFDFSSPRTFSGRNFDYDIVNREQSRLKSEDSYIPKVFHLYKLHGSLNWEKQETGKVIMKDTPENPHIIYPASDKYESSYEQPYFEMMSRFQQAVRKDKSLLIVIGFGFQDKHIQNVIKEAVAQNPNFQLVILNFNGNNGIDTELLQDFLIVSDDAVKTKMNVTVLFGKFCDFTENYPENQTYRQEHEGEYEQ